MLRRDVFAGASTMKSPQTYARLGGLLYLILIAAGVISQTLIRGPMTVGGDAAATAANIAASAQMWRVSIALDLIMHLCDIGLMLVFYVLLKPVSKNLVLLAVLFNLVQTVVLVLNKATLVVPLLLLGDSAYLKAFEPAQLQALSYVAIRFHDYGFGFGLIFFGVECLILGYQIVRSGRGFENLPVDPGSAASGGIGTGRCGCCSWG